jgi:hypothetical protein
LIFLVYNEILQVKKIAWDEMFQGYKIQGSSIRAPGWAGIVMGLKKLSWRIEEKNEEFQSIFHGISAKII